MEKTYLSISITYYNSTLVRIPPHVYYYRDDGKGVTSTCDKLTPEEANKLMWELVRLGGKNSYSANSLDPSISYREVKFYGRL